MTIAVGLFILVCVVCYAVIPLVLSVCVFRHIIKARPWETHDDPPA